MKKEVEVKVGSIWNTVDIEYFIVTKVEKKGEHVWVSYRPYKPLEKVEKEYSCYQGAFIQRFFKFNNTHYAFFYGR